jgi:hypothetical protein
VESIVAGAATANICILLASQLIVTPAAQDAVVPFASPNIVGQWTAQNQFAGIRAITRSTCRRTHNDGRQIEGCACSRLEIIDSDDSFLVCEAGRWDGVGGGNGASDANQD